MRKKVALLGASCLMVIGLALLSCAPPATTPTPTAPAPTAPRPTAPPPAAPVASEKGAASEIETPTYGGVLTLIASGEPTAFGDINPAGQTWPQKLTNQELLTGDWARGAAGTGEFAWTQNSVARFDTKAGQLAESWEIVEPGHIVFKIRRGVHWALEPKSEASRLVGGRELTADDILNSFRRYTTDSRSYLVRSYPDVSATANMTAPDKYTIHIKSPLQWFPEAMLILPDAIHVQIFPAELVNKYGDLMQNWRNNVGTGAFMLSDYVAGSSLTFVSNSNYWEKDPAGAGKGNQLPYVDTAKFLIIPDRSTQIAALMTAKLDWGSTFLPDDAKSLMKTTPEVKRLTFFDDGTSAIYMRLDKPQLPFKDIRVRRALMMAIDFLSIKNDLYGSEAELVAWPLAQLKEFKNAYLPLEEAPESVRELWRYNPEKAKQLLAEAGYPKGFKTSVVLTSSSVDLLSIVKAMWAKVGVDLELQVKEAAVYNNIQNARTNDEMIIATVGRTGANYLRFFTVDGPSRNNASYVDDPHVKEVKAQMYDYFNRLNEAKVDELSKQLMGYILDQAWAIPMPAAHLTMFWWPWLKNYHGEVSVGNQNQDWMRYVWLDRDLKKKMGH